MNTEKRVYSDEEEIRLDHYLVKQFSDYSRTQIQKMIKNDHVTVNDCVEKVSYKLQEGDSIHIEFMEFKTGNQNIIPEPIPLDILFEDDEILVINKQAGLVVHPGTGNYTGTLVHGLKYYCTDLSSVNDASRPGIVHRLDQYTSGVMVVAKTNNAHRKIAAQFQDRLVTKTYLGITWGVWKEQKGSINASLKRSRKDPTSFRVDETGRSAVTDYSVLKEYRYMSVVEFSPKTGRTHQLRVHAAHMNHSVINDEKYNGGLNRTKGFLPEVQRDIKLLLKKLGRHALHAQRLSFTHPQSGEMVNFTVELPQDMQSLIDYMQAHYG